MNLKLFDKRIVARNIEKGLVTQADYQKFLEALEDAAGRCEQIEVSLFGEDKEETPGDAHPEPREKA